MIENVMENTAKKATWLNTIANDQIEYKYLFLNKKDVFISVNNGV